MPTRRLFCALLLLTGLLPAGTVRARAETVGAAEVGAASGGGRCALLLELALPGGKFACTHGADPAPEGVDPDREWTPDAARVKTGFLFPDPLIGSKTSAAGLPGAPCYGDGQSGDRVQAVYARPADRPDRYTQVLPFIRRWAGDVDTVLNASAAEVGATRHVRYVTNSSCQVAVDYVVLSSRGDLNLATTMAEMAVLGYSRPDRKYLVWMDAVQLCGVAAYYHDDRASRDNFNNGIPESVGVVARIDSGCWGLGAQGESIEAHELMHSLGSVQLTAPHATLLGHCTDESDRMCYEDGTSIFLQSVCDDREEALFDCDKDDYFNPNPPAGSYLATHWNTAGSEFVADLMGDVPVSVSGGGAITEGDLDSKVVNFVISLQLPIRQTAKVYYDTTNGSATAGSDYDPVSGVVVFAPGETQKVVSVPIRGDFAVESDEDFLFRIFNPSEAAVDTAFATGTILNDDPKGQGYWLVATDGGVFSYADAGFFGSTGGIRLNQPIVGMAATPSGRGYWMVARDGGIFSFGDAGFFGSTGGIRLNQPIVGMAPTPTGEGYWLVAADGGVFAFGDAAASLGSAAGQRLDAPVVALAPTATGQGYWVVGQGGRVFAFGDAADFGSTPRLNQPIVAATSTPTGKGLWLVATDGGIFAFGDAPFLGSTGDIKLNKPVVGMSRSPSGLGYWLVATDGGIFNFGDAGFFGSTGNIRLNQPMVGMTAMRAPLA
jgi:hypothetical protein